MKQTIPYNTTVEKALQNHRTPICLMGHDRVYVIGDTAYRFENKTTSPFLRKGTPVVFIEGKWVSTQLANSTFTSIYRDITVIDQIN